MIDKPLPHTIFDLGSDCWSWQSSLMYFGHNDPTFPIGYIGGGAIGADQARNVVEQQLGDIYGPIVHVALAPHDGTNGVGHNRVVCHGELRENQTHVCDAVILAKHERPFAIETMLGDCACIIVSNDDYLGFIHCGTPELFAGLLGDFFVAWPTLMGMTEIFLGPCITGRNYLYDPKKVPHRFHSFLRECDGEDTVWDEGWTFGLAEAISAELRTWGARSITDCVIDPFTENVNGNHQWASARYWKDLKDRLEIGDGLSPRNCAFFVYRPPARR